MMKKRRTVILVVLGAAMVYGGESDIAVNRFVDPMNWNFLF